jgi:hypothetical protein
MNDHETESNSFLYEKIQKKVKLRIIKGILSREPIFFFGFGRATIKGNVVEWDTPAVGKVGSHTARFNSARDSR